jgi:phage protein D
VPTGYTPIFSVIKDGEDITGRFSDRCTAIEVDLRNGGGSGDVCRIHLDDRDWRISSPAYGAKIEVNLGYQEVGMAWMGQFEIEEVNYEGPPRSIVITGTSSGTQSTLKAPTIKNFDNKTVGDIVRDIAKSGGIDAVISDDLASKKLPFKNQFSSNFHLLHELERQFGALAKFEGGKLIFKSRDDGNTATGNAMPILVLKPEHFEQWSVRHNQRAEFSKVKAGYWDKDEHVRKWVEHANPNFTGDSTKDLEFPINKMHNSKEEAEAAAKARVESFRRSMGNADIVLAKGDPWVRDQMQLLIGGMREGINGSYVIDQVKHSYRKGQGIKSTISAKPPGTGENYSDLAATNEFMSPKPGETLGEYLLGPGGRAVGRIGQAPGV